MVMCAQMGLSKKKTRLFCIYFCPELVLRWSTDILPALEGSESSLANPASGLLPTSANLSGSSSAKTSVDLAA